MARYTTKPVVRGWTDYESFESSGFTEGREVHDTGDWSDDQPTGILTASGDMIYRTARRIGYLADN